MTLAARDWPEAAPTSAANALIPIGTIQPEPGTQFGATMTAPYIYRTAAGILQVFYRADPTTRTGTIEVAAKNAEGAPLLTKDYTIRWG